MKINALLMVLMIFIVLLAGCKEARPPIDKDEFENLNKCYSDQECVIGQQNVGRDLASPPPKCVTKAVVDKFGDHWFESKNQVVIASMQCFCNLTSNSCYEKGSSS